MVANARRATIADLDAMPDDGRIYELLNGEISMAAAPTWRHGVTVLAIRDVLHAWVRPSRLGVVQVAPIDVILDDDNVVQPDVIFVERSQLSSAASGRYIGAPTLAVEVVSPTSRGRDSVQKSQRYARAGIREFWLVDPDNRTFDIYTLVDDFYQPVPLLTDGRIESVVLPGLIFDPADIFAEVDDQTP